MTIVVAIVYCINLGNEKCLGFIYYMTNGVFGSYPYLHIVAVKEEYRSCGIGKQLMKFFEDNKRG